MRQAETSPDQAAVTKKFVDLFRCGIGRYIKVLWFDIEQQVSHSATHQAGMKTRIVQTV